MMINILCYGDSNTWGYNPALFGLRHGYKQRWTTILGDLLGDDFHIIPEGLNGRTSVWDDPIKGGVNGKDYLLPCLQSHKPLDLVVLFLGTNDLKKRLGLSASEIADSVGVLVDIIKKSDCGSDGKIPEVLVIIPPEVRTLSNFLDQFGECKSTSLEFPEQYKRMAEAKGVDYLNIGESVRFSDIDGIHFEKDQLPLLASIIKDKIVKMIS